MFEDQNKHSYAFEYDESTSSSAKQEINIDEPTILHYRDSIKTINDENCDSRYACEPWGFSGRAVFPGVSILKFLLFGRVAANKTSPYFHHGSVAATCNITPNLCPLM